MSQITTSPRPACMLMTATTTQSKQILPQTCVMQATAPEVDQHTGGDEDKDGNEEKGDRMSKPIVHAQCQEEHLKSMMTTTPTEATTARSCPFRVLIQPLGGQEPPEMWEVVAQIIGA